MDWREAAEQLVYDVPTQHRNGKIRHGNPQSGSFFGHVCKPGVMSGFDNHGIPPRVLHTPQPACGTVSNHP